MVEDLVKAEQQDNTCMLLFLALALDLGGPGWEGQNRMHIPPSCRTYQDDPGQQLALSEVGSESVAPSGGT